MQLQKLAKCKIDDALIYSVMFIGQPPDPRSCPCKRYPNSIGMASRHNRFPFDSFPRELWLLIAENLGVKDTGSLICANNMLRNLASTLLSHAFVVQAPGMNHTWQANAIDHMLANDMKADLLSAVKGSIVGPTLTNATHRLNFMFVRGKSPYSALIDESIDGGALSGVSYGGINVKKVFRKMIFGPFDNPSKALCINCSDDFDAADAMRAEEVATHHAIGVFHMYSITESRFDVDVASQTMGTLVDRNVIYVSFSLSIDVSALKHKMGDGKSLVVVALKPEELESDEAKQMLRDLQALVDLPERFCLLLDFISECSYVEDGKLTLPEGYLSYVPIGKVIVGNSTGDITGVGDKFLMDYSSQYNNLKSVDLSGLKNLQSIGGFFLAQCTGVESVNLSKLKNLQSMGGYFMFECEGLGSVDFSELKNLRSVGNSFMSGCVSLKSVDLSELKNLRSVGDGFMRGCVRLRSVDLSGLKNLQRVGDSFMSYCIGLECVDPNELKNLQSVGNHFMACCYKLGSADLSGWQNLQSVGDGFMFECEGLQSADLSRLTNLQSIGDGFMSGCVGLESVNLGELKNLQSVGNHFMLGCEGLGSVDLSGLKNLQSVGDEFMSGCTWLHSVDLSGLKNLQSMGDKFMFECEGLQSVDVSELKNLLSVGNCFMSGCVSLNSVDLSELKNLQSVGDEFMSRCTGLHSVDLSGLKNLQSVGDEFMSRCKGLGSVDLSGLTGLKSIGEGFLIGGGCGSVDMSWFHGERR